MSFSAVLSVIMEKALEQRMVSYYRIVVITKLT